MLNVGYILFGYKGCLKVISFNWLKKKNETGNAWIKVYAAIRKGALGIKNLLIKQKSFLQHFLNNWLSKYNKPSKQNAKKGIKKNSQEFFIKSNPLSNLSSGAD